MQKAALWLSFIICLTGCNSMQVLKDYDDFSKCAIFYPKHKYWLHKEILEKPSFIATAYFGMHRVDCQGAPRAWALYIYLEGYDRFLWLDRRTTQRLIVGGKTYKLETVLAAENRNAKVKAKLGGSTRAEEEAELARILVMDGRLDGSKNPEFTLSSTSYEIETEEMPVLQLDDELFQELLSHEDSKLEIVGKNGRVVIELSKAVIDTIKKFLQRLPE